MCPQKPKTLWVGIRPLPSRDSFLATRRSIVYYMASDAVDVHADRWATMRARLFARSTNASESELWMPKYDVILKGGTR